MAYQTVKFYRDRNTGSLVNSFRCCSNVLLLLFMALPMQSLQAIVTSDDPPPPSGNSGVLSHLVFPNSTPFGMDLDGVARLFLFADGGVTSVTIRNGFAVKKFRLYLDRSSRSRCDTRECRTV